MNDHNSPDVFNHIERGPFPGRVDPWAEAAHYFQQLHSGMIGHLQVQLKRPLFALGYLIEKEASLQIEEKREPDLHVRREAAGTEQVQRWDYTAAAAAISAEPGVAVAGSDVDFQALFIRSESTGDLVTVIEIISPRNKTHTQDILEYRTWRTRMVTHHRVNVVELDLTRSVKRLLESVETAAYAYHAAVYLPSEAPRVIGMPFNAPLKRLALPLRGEVVPMELQSAYENAYRDGFIAGLLLKDEAYKAENLPFPTTLTAGERQTAIEAVQGWMEELARLRA